MPTGKNLRKRGNDKSGNTKYVVEKGYYSKINLEGTYPPEDPKIVKQRQIDKNNRQNLIENIAQCFIDLGTTDINSVFNLLKEKNQLPSAFDLKLLYNRIRDQQKAIMDKIAELKEKTQGETVKNGEIGKDGEER